MTPNKFAFFATRTILCAAILGNAHLAWAQQPDQFDLTCAGRQTETGKPATPYKVHYRIDIVAKRWCDDAKCDNARPIEDVTPARITLYVEQNDELHSSIQAVLSYVIISRTNGSLVDVSTSIGYGMFLETERRAQCTPAPFSGLPAAKF
jgi:hypothetical protein